MSNYYYLSSSLPFLLFHHVELPIRYYVFLDDCRRLVNKQDYIQIQKAQLNTDILYPDSISTFRIWQSIDFTIRNQLVKIRAKNLNKSAESFIRLNYDDAIIAETVREIIDETTPLRAEIRLLEFQWQILDNLQTGHLFDLDFLLIYSLKLQILERKVSFVTEDGKSRLFQILKQENS